MKILNEIATIFVCVLAMTLIIIGMVGVVMVFLS